MCALPYECRFELRQGRKNAEDQAAIRRGGIDLGARLREAFEPDVALARWSLRGTIWELVGTQQE